MTTMDAKTRVRTAFALGEPDRVPVMQMAFYHGARLLGRRIGDIRNLDVAVEALVAVCDRYEPDLITPSFGCKTWLYGDLGIEMRQPEDGFESVVEPYWKTPRDVDEKPLPDPRDPTKKLHTHIRLLTEFTRLRGDKAVLASFGGSTLGRTGDLVGVENILLMLLENPSLAHKIIEKVAAWTIDLAKASIDAGTEVIGLVDPTAGGSVISRKHFIEFSVPILKWANEEIKKHKNVPTYLHICGDVRDRLDLMADTGVDAISIDNMVDLGFAKEAVGDRVCIIGNVDPVRTLLLGSPADVERDSRHCIAQAGKDGGFILAPGCGVAPDTAPANLEMMTATARAYGRYPLTRWEVAK